MVLDPHLLDRCILPECLWPCTLATTAPACTSLYPCSECGDRAPDIVLDAVSGDCAPGIVLGLSRDLTGASWSACLHD